MLIETIKASTSPDMISVNPKDQTEGMGLFKPIAGLEWDRSR
jgi:hypothetical protein